MPRLHEKLLSALELSAADSPLALADPVGTARQARVPESRIMEALGAAMDAPVLADLANRPASAEFVSRIPIGFARRHQLLGLAGGNGHVNIAIGNLSAWNQLPTLAKLLGKPVEPILCPGQQVLAAINLAYQRQSGHAQQVIEQMDRQEVLGQVEKIRHSEDLLDVATRAPVIKLVNLMLFEAVRLRASDVHVHPYEDRLVVRFRIDGVLYDFFTPPKPLQDEIISRIKVMGHMNIAEKRLAQDGRATVEVGDRVVDLRIATLPTSFGERVVLRLLDTSVRLYRLGDLGMDERTLEEFRRMISFDHGIVLVTGPTGSGKTTTLYAALQELNSKEANILTLEDPIEYRLEGISQTQVNEKKGMTFASGLRHVLRQDPDIIMVGEIRDSETAHMAIQSALTGHLVFSTLHTNDAASAVARLLDLGAEPYLVASSLIAVVAQRLVRRICPHCSAEYQPTDQDWARWQLDASTLDGTVLRRGSGCKECFQTGYYDRAGVFELLCVNETIRAEVMTRASASVIRQRAMEAGMRTLRQSALQRAAAGETSLDEVARVAARMES